MNTLKEAWDKLFGPKAEPLDFSATTLEALFDEIENDPRAGLGNLSKRKLLIDKIISQHRIVTAQYRQIVPKKPAPAMSGEPADAFVLGTPVQLAAAQAAKKAGM